MMKKITKIILFVILPGLVFSSCQKKICEDIVPGMTFKDFNPSTIDSGYYVLTFDFKDCDGDIGMETTSSILDEHGERQINNFFIDLYHVVDNKWVKHDYGQQNAGLDYKIPILNNSKGAKNLEGVIERKLDPIFGLVGYDSVMFKSKILDNEGHYSNEVTTPGFRLN